MRIQWRPPKTDQDNKDQLAVLIELEYAFRKAMTRLFLVHDIDFECEAGSNSGEIEFLFCTETRKFMLLSTGCESCDKISSLLSAPEVSEYFA